MRAFAILGSALVWAAISCTARAADLIEVTVTGKTWSGGGSGTYFNGSGSSPVPEDVPMTVEFTLDATQLEHLDSVGGSGETYFNAAGAGSCAGISLPQVPLLGDYVAADSTLSGTAPTFNRTLGGQSGGNMRNCDYVSLDDYYAGGDGVVITQDAYNAPTVYYVDGDLTTVSPTQTSYYRQETRVHRATLNGVFDGNPFSTDELLTDLIGSFAINATWGANVRVQFSRSVYQCWNPGGAGYRCQNMPMQAWDQYDVQSIASAVVGVKVGSHDLAALTLTKSEIPGCKPVTGTVTLTGAAPVGGVVVQLSDNLATTTMPGTVTVPENLTSKTFVISSAPVTVTQNGTVSAKVGTTIKTQPLTVRPMGLTSVTLTPSIVVGGNPVLGKATLECNAGPGPVTVDLSSGNPPVASPVAAGVGVVVPQGLRSANFDVTTNAVQAKSYATIAATANGITKSKRLTVNVAAAVSQTSLRFGNVNVGTTSGPLFATLTNKGATSFSISSILLTGTFAKWFGMTENCPTSLAPGASCTITATFNPLEALTKSATVSITTSATSLPLKLTLSGTGI